jgi:hypothetical protein
MGAWTQDPLWVDKILNWSWIFLAARLALTSSFLLGGFTKLFVNCRRAAASIKITRSSANLEAHMARAVQRALPGGIRCRILARGHALPRTGDERR